MKLLENFKTIYGRDPTAKETQDIMRFITKIGIKENDALLLFFLFESHNLSRLEAIPKLVQDASENATRDARSIAKGAVGGAVSDAIPRLVKAVNDQVKAHSGALAAAQRYKMIAIAAASMAVLALSCGGFGWWVGQKQVEEARQFGYFQGSQNNAFLSTQEGQLAASWYRSGTLAHLINCDRPGWYRGTQGYCMIGVIKEKDGTTTQYGWK